MCSTIRLPALDKVAKLSNDANANVCVCEGEQPVLTGNITLFEISGLFVFCYLTGVPYITAAHEGRMCSVCFGNLLCFDRLSYIPVTFPYMQIMKPDTLAS